MTTAFLPLQTTTVLDVLRGDADIGLIRSDVLSWMADSGTIDERDFKVLEPRMVDGYPWPTTTDVYPEWVISAMSWTNPDLAEDISRVSQREGPIEASFFTHLAHYH